MTVWSGYPETGYQQTLVLVSTDIDADCMHYEVAGCVTQIGGQRVIIVDNPFAWDARGCNTLTHEWLHLMGFKEYQLPYCNDLKVPRYMMEYLRNQS